MNALKHLIDLGGPVMIALMAVAVLLYERCFSLLLFLFRARRDLRVLLVSRIDAATMHTFQHQLEERFRQQRVAIDALITAAPLLGLLGTVMGMIGAFTNLSAMSGQRSMEGLARGISEVLIATETGLAVAIPAILLVYYAHRQLQKGLLQLAQLQARPSA